MKKYALIILLGLGACGGISVDQINPAVSNFNGDSVSIQLSQLMDIASPEVQAAAIKKADEEAVRICQKGSKKRAELASTRQIPVSTYSYMTERLYLCLR